MISYKNKFILITPQKTGSTSLVTALRSYISCVPSHGSKNGWRDFNYENFDYGDDFEGHYAKHNKLYLYYDNWNKVKQQQYQSTQGLPQYPLSPWVDMGEINDYFIAGAIRNPFDRLVSWWDKEGSLMEFICTLPTCAGMGMPIQDLSDAYLSLWSWFTRGHAHEWRFDPETKTHSRTKQNVDDLFFIRFENLQQDFDTFCDKVNIPRQVLPHKNKSERKHYTEYYDNATRELVERMYAKDLEYFGYKFGD